MDAELRWSGAIERLSQTELARRLGLTPRQIRNLEKKGLPYGYPKKKGSDKEYPWPTCNLWYIDFRIQSEFERLGRKPDLDGARARKEDALARRAEWDLAKDQGKFVSAVFLRAQVGRVLEQCVVELRTLTGRWKDELVDLPSAADVQNKLEPLVESAIGNVQRAALDGLLTADPSGADDESEKDVDDVDD